MDVIFCDICNESVPLDDLREGRAQRVKQRVVCAACQSAMGGETAPATRGGPVPAPHRSVVRPRRTVAGEWVAVASMLTMVVARAPAYSRRGRNDTDANRRRFPGELGTIWEVQGKTRVKQIC